MVVTVPSCREDRRDILYDIVWAFELEQKSKEGIPETAPETHHYCQLFPKQWEIPVISIPAPPSWALSRRMPGRPPARTCPNLSPCPLLQQHRANVLRRVRQQGTRSLRATVCHFSSSPYSPSPPWLLGGGRDKGSALTVQGKLQPACANADDTQAGAGLTGMGYSRARVNRSVSGRSVWCPNCSYINPA